jgi:hypothetical protein
MVYRQVALLVIHDSLDLKNKDAGIREACVPAIGNGNN